MIRHRYKTRMELRHGTNTAPKECGVTNCLACKKRNLQIRFGLRQKQRSQMKDSHIQWEIDMAVRAERLRILKILKAYLYSQPTNDIYRDKLMKPIEKLTRREFLLLPMAERRAILSQQTEELLKACPEYAKEVQQ